MKSQIKIWIVCLSVLGILGTVIFFPVNFDNRYTCLYHRMRGQKDGGLFLDANSGMLIKDSAQAGMIGDIRANRFSGRETAPAEGNNPAASWQDNDRLLSRYISKYAFFWWGSLGLLTLCFFLQKRRRMTRQNQNDIRRTNN